MNISSLNLSQGQGGFSTYYYDVRKAQINPNQNY